MNQWVAEKTEGYITELLHDMYRPLDVAKLLGAVSLKGGWSVPFDPKRTVPGTFTSTDGIKLPARFMKRTAEMPVAQVCLPWSWAQYVYPLSLWPGLRLSGRTPYWRVGGRGLHVSTCAQKHSEAGYRRPVDRGV